MVKIFFGRKFNSATEFLKIYFNGTVSLGRKLQLPDSESIKVSETFIRNEKSLIDNVIIPALIEAGQNTCSSSYSSTLRKRYFECGDEIMGEILRDNTGAIYYGKTLCEGKIGEPIGTLIDFTYTRGNKACCGYCNTCCECDEPSTPVDDISSETIFILDC